MTDNKLDYERQFYDMRICYCGKEVDRADMRWTKDRYNVPYKLVCPECFPKVQAEIEDWKFDPSYAGESLDCD